MSWSRRFEARELMRNSLWLIPVLGIGIGILMQRIITRVEDKYPAPAAFQFSAGAAETLLAAIFAAMISFTGFVLTILVLVVQFAGTAFSPRALLFVFRDKQLKLSLSFFIGTMTLSFLLLTQTSADTTPYWGILICGISVLVSLMLFLQFLSHLLHGIRPANISSQICAIGHQAIEELYPDPAPQEVAPHETQTYVAASLIPEGKPLFVETKSGAGQTVQGIDIEGLVNIASRNDALFVLTFSVGDFILRSGDLVHVYAKGASPFTIELEDHIAFGAERTPEQDPAFALRVIVDIAVKALSAAINDPTTATNAIDRIEDMLADLVVRDLRAGVIRDQSETPRIIRDTPSWDDYLTLGITEVRVYGAGSIQTMRRLRSLLTSLLEIAPEYRKSSIQEELVRLDRSIHKNFPDSLDQRIASIADNQGFGATEVQRT